MTQDPGPTCLWPDCSGAARRYNDFCAPYLKHPPIEPKLRPGPTACEYCGAPITQAHTGRLRRYCTHRCRDNAWKRRHRKPVWCNGPTCNDLEWCLDWHDCLHPHPDTLGKNYEHGW